MQLPTHAALGTASRVLTGSTQARLVSDWSLPGTKIQEVGVAVPTSPVLEIYEACLAFLVGEVPTASLCRGTGNCGWDLWAR